MKAVILASGLGTRFKNKTKHLPKCLIEIEGKTILERMLLSLINPAITEIIITTGFLDTQIKNFVKSKTEFKKLKITFVYNPLFSQTNYIYSLWLTRKKIADEDILLLHSDLLYDTSLLNRFIVQKQSSVAVNKYATVPKKDFKARIKNEKITEIGVDVFGKDAFLCMPMYTVLKKDMSIWMKQIDTYVSGKKITCYAEDALNDVSNKITLSPLYFDKELCMEIDNDEDLSLAMKLLSS